MSGFDSKPIRLNQLPYDPEKVFDEPMGEITQSSVQTYLRCPQKYTFRYLMLIDRGGVSMPLLIGSAVHDGLEYIFQRAADGFDIEKRSEITAALAKVDKSFTDLEDRPDLTIGLDDKIEHSRAVAHACLDAWHTVYGSEVKKWKVFESEINMRARDGRAGAPVADRMAGKLDGLIQYLRDKSVWLLEHKTRSRMDNLDILGLELDLQALWYMILRIYRSKTGDSPDDYPLPTGFLYNAIQKPQHRMARAGWAELRDRMYNAMVESPAKYFRLEPVPVERATLDSAYENALRIVAGMDRLAKGNVHRNLTACNDFGGCPYRSLCTARADVNKPSSVFTTPGIEQFSFRPIHTELDK